MREVADQAIVITGASSGIGLTTAKEAARRGARVVLAARSERDLDEAVEAIRRDGGEAVAVPTDVADYGQVEALARRAVEAYGRIDTWVNAAAVMAYASFKDVSLDDFRQVVEIDFMGQVHGAKAALPYLEESAGALVCIGSAFSDRGAPLVTAYSAAKHAIKGWLDGLRVELEKEGSPVRVTLVKPASINTPLFDKAKTQLGVRPAPLPPVYPPERVAEAILRAAQSDERDVYVGRAGKALSVAERISPRMVDAQMRLTGFEMQTTDEPKPAEAPNNLYAPLDDEGGEHAAWSRYPPNTYRPLTEHPVASSLVAAAALGLGAYALRRAA